MCAVPACLTVFEEMPLAFLQYKRPHLPGGMDPNRQMGRGLRFTAEEEPF